MWLPLSFAYAFFDSLQNLYFKKTALHVHPVIMTWSVLVISSICFSPLLLRGVPTLDTIFWVTILARLILDSAALTLFITGVQKSPLSLTIPMISLSPVLSVGTVFLFSGLLPSTLGFVGVLITVAGLYFLNFDHDTKHLLSPFHAIFRERGVLYVTIAAIIWSFVSALQKLGIDHSDAYFYTAFFQIVWALFFTPIAFFVDRKSFLCLWQPKSLKLLIPGGVLDAIKMLLHNLAYITAIPAYVNSIGNTSILLSTLFGAVFFKEKIKDHLIPVILIFIGITLMVLGK